MSSGLPPILSSNQNTQPSFPNPFSHFSYLFGGQNQPIGATGLQSGGGGSGGQSHNSRYKVKRHRQRVDAGEPRNTYQGTSSKSKLIDNNSSSTASSINWQSSYINQPSILLPKSSSNRKTIEEVLNNGSEESTEVSTVTMGGESNNMQLSEESGEKEGGDELYEDRKRKGDEVKEEQEDGEGGLEGMEEGGEEGIDGGEEDEEDGKNTDSREESPESSTSSASKRKSFLPRKIEEQLGIELNGEPEQINVTVGNGTSSNEKEEEEKQPTNGLSALQAQLAASPNKFIELQKKIWTAMAIDNQRKQMAAFMNYDQVCQILKPEVLTILTKSLEKTVKDWATSEMARDPSATTNGSTPVVAPQPPQPPVAPPFHPMFPIPNPNALAPFQLHHPHTIGGGIFPPNLAAISQLNAFNALRRNLEDSEPKKKRMKLAEAKKEEGTGSARGGSPSSAPMTPPNGHSTPLNRYFPPTMVGHPLYNNVSFGQQDREDSPTNSDDMSDYGYEGNGNATLTPMHLRKAKLMFFYTRYPNSNVLKTYFPDIRFNKNNTAQLVKWFSNFREFYYNQIEKFGRQLLAEGIKSRDEIFVSRESELFKVLNTHYNRNNHIRAPDRLIEVVQETLREFFDAIKLDKDVEPSWKKTIYKLINPMDGAIPDFFKEPNFLERLET